VDRAVVQVEFRDPPAEELRLLEQAEQGAEEQGRADTAAESRRN
jgi:hypothetical protein